MTVCKKKLQRLNSIIDALKFKCKYLSMNGISNYSLKYLGTLQNKKEKMGNLCQVKKN